jgi:5-methylcytosine-specific restriction endonuclease McrA
MAKDKFETQLTSFIKNLLRRASMRWPHKNDALAAARVSRGNYRCAMCKNEFKRDQVDLDHVEPVVSLTEGYVDWDVYIRRLFVKAEGYQVLCKTCHGAKTAIEDKVRATMNQHRKDKDKQLKKIDKLTKKE